MVVLGVVDVADSLMLDGFVDGTVHSCAEETLFEEFGGGGEVAGVLLVTEVAGFLRGVFGGEGGGVNFGGEWSVGVAVDGCWDCFCGGAGFVDDDGWGKSGHGELLLL